MGQGAIAAHVEYCRAQVRSGRATCRELAQEFGVTERAVQACVYGHTYAHVPGALKSPQKKPRRRKRSTRLSEDEVRAIREQYAAGEVPVREIAEKYGISSSYVVLLGRGIARKDVPGDVTLDRTPVRRVDHKTAARRGERHPNARLDALSVVAIRTLEKRGIEHARIADIFGTTPENVCMIARRRRWQHVPDMALTPAALEHLPPLALKLLDETSGGSNLPRAS